MTQEGGSEAARARARARPSAGGTGVEVHIRTRAAAFEVARIRSAVNEAAEAWGMSEAARADVAIAVSEACSNVVTHAYADAVAPGPLCVDTSRRSGEFVVVVSDEGTGITPRVHSPGMGLGLALIARLTHRLEIGSNGLGGAKVTMAFSGQS